MLHQHGPKIKRPHLLSLGGSCCSKKLKSFSSTLKFKLNTSVWVGWHIYFNLWNSHGWSPLHRGWLYPESTYLPGGPKTAKKDWLAPPFQPGVSAHSQRWQQKQNTGVRKWPVCSAHPPFLYPQGAPVSEVGYVTPESHTPFSVTDNTRSLLFPWSHGAQEPVT